MRILIIFLFFYLPIIGFAQNHKIEIFNKTFVKLYINPKIDYNKSIEDETEEINFKKNLISPNFALLLYKNQNDRFCYKNYIFQWNEVPINLFEELQVVKNKFPSHNLIEKDNIVELSNGVSLRFTEYNNKKYLIDISITLRRMYNPKNNNFGIFLIDGFPLNGETYQDKEFTLLLENLNKSSKYDFHYSRSYTFSTPFKKIEVKNLEIFEKYFDTEKFRRTQNKKIEFQIVMTKNSISFSNNIVYDGIDPEYVQREAPRAN